MDKYSRRHFFKDSALITAGISFSKFSFAHTETDHTYTSIAELSELIRLKKISPVTITKACLKRIEQLDPLINSFITVMKEEALAAAKIAEAEIRNGKWRGPLHGIPVGLKDNIDTAGVLTTAASGVYKNRVPEKDAVLVTKLKNAGAIIIGKLNMHEFALGTTSHISYFGAVHNPWNKDYIAGGSSGGSAAAVAAGLCYAAIGTDTGGSNRLPPACCGVTGLKATYGLVSIEGIIPVIKSNDHAGPICRSVQDTAILLNALASPAIDNYGAGIDFRKSFQKNNKPVIGVMKNYKASDEVETVFREAIKVFRSQGCTITDVVLPEIPETSGFAVAEIEAYHQHLITEYKNDYNPVTLAGMEGLKKVSAADYINQRNQMDEDRITISKNLFKDIDVMILPATTTATPTLEAAKTNGPFALDPFNTDSFNYYGLPVISIPCGVDKNGLPLGMQLVGPRWGEAEVLDAADKYQQAATWHLKHPFK